MKKLVSTVVVIAMLGVLVYSQRAVIAERVMTKGLESRLDLNIMDDFEDGLHLVLCGAGGPMPAPKVWIYWYTKLWRLTYLS